MALDEHTIQQFIATAGQHHFTSDLPSHLECSICQNLLEDPVVCDNGSHTFCKKCLIDWMGRSERPLCPIDREDLKVTPQGPRRAPRALQDCIDALELVCALGCGWKGGKGEWPDHLRRECSEVEDDNNPDRRARSGSIPLAIREQANKPRSTAEPARRQVLPPVNEELEQDDEDEDDTNEAEYPPEHMRTGATCDVCDSDIFHEGFMCVVCKNYDLCMGCWYVGERNAHDPAHGFVKIRSRKDFYPGEGGQSNSIRENDRSTNIHINIDCDGCDQEGIVGVRYHCTVCDDFDLCRDCVESPRLRHETHRLDHEMIRIVKPRRTG